MVVFMVVVVLMRGMLVVVLVIILIIIMVATVVRLSLRYRSWLVVIFTKNRDVQPGYRSHPSSPNSLSLNLEFIGQFGHAHT